MFKQHENNVMKMRSGKLRVFTLIKKDANLIKFGDTGSFTLLFWTFFFNF